MARRFSRRTRALAVGLLMLALLGGFAGTCAGANTPEVQKPVSETKLRYEQFLRQVGVLGSTGQVSAPWIVAPEEDASLSGDFEISGWSARPSDIAGQQNATSAYVRLFIVPAPIWDGFRTFRGYEITTATRTAPVDLKTGEWSLDANSIADTYAGDCMLVAVTHIGGVSGPESTATMIRVSSEDGARKSTGDAWPAAEETVYVATAMVRPKGERFADGAEQQLRDLVDSVKRYYRDASRGRVKVELIYEAGVRDLDVKDSVLVDDWDRYKAHITDAVSWIPAEKLPPAGSVFALIAAQPGPDGRQESPQGRSTHSISWVNISDVASISDKKWRGSFINLPLDQGDGQDMVGVVAHELAHGLGSFPGTGKEALPDLYENPDNGYTPVDFNNFDEISPSLGYNVGNYFLMANNRAVNPCAYSQEWLGWLTYQDVKLADLKKQSAEVLVPYLDGTLARVNSVPRVVWTEADGRESFTVIEGRTGTRSDWDAKLPKAGLVVYKVRSAKAGERSQSLWPRSINWCTLISASTAQFYDVAQGYIIRRTHNLSGGANEEVEVVPAPAAKEGASAAEIGNALVGVTMRTDMPDIAWGDARIATVRGEDESASVSPDLDLHAYLADGTHIGVDYKTGVFENPVSGALVSGDMVMDAEWIVLPRELAEGARFEVTSEDAVAFEKAFPDAAPEGLDLGYQVEPTLVDATTDGIARGEAQKATLKPGETASTALSGGGALKLTPLAQGAGAPTGLSAVDPILWELGGAGLLVMIGLVVLLWPVKR